MSFWKREKTQKLDPGLAKALLESVREEIFPGVSAGVTNRFVLERCQHCLGLHSRKCPAVSEVSYHESGKVARVVYFPKGQWDENDVLWLEDVMEAAQEDEPDGQP